MAEPGAPVALVVGGGGLLGSAVVRELRRQGRPFATVSVPWGDRRAAVDALADAAERLLDQGRPWYLHWCAGSGVVGSDPGQLDDEVATFDAFLDRLATLVDRPATPPGVLFLASSAGGVYAGSPAPPFTEDTEALPISPYGHAKLAAEESARGFAHRSGVRVLIGRIANLYGPGQDPDKAQGLITVLCRAHLAREPASIYVSLDTARDYVYVDDVARLVTAAADRASLEPAGTVVVKILATQSGTTVAAILGELRRITKHRPRVVIGSSPLAKFQARSLRFRSVVWPDLDWALRTSLPAGMHATMQSAAMEAQRSQPSPS